MFSRRIDDYWTERLGPTPPGLSVDNLAVAIRDHVDDAFRVMILLPATGPARAILTPEVADLIGQSDSWTLAGFQEALVRNGVVLHGADYIFYAPEEALVEIVSTPAPASVRRLTADDADLFAVFEGAASARDLEDASVALDDWAAFGAFENGRLAAVGSLYPWRGGATLADLGVLTLLADRGKGHARALVHAMARHALASGLSPQYRCQLDNQASVALAASAGFRLYGKWTVEAPDGTT
ncbi:GNAT family N-acetyltransferase [Caulobacter mirabilis]|uniref:GNAT family N-acetyltransferase n=1 Tax=Caulobacter mirabilis TaxID=69666 RepID=A0A2D2B0E5_9CAUL|nr:GNAT family N-acetyltransferase [Caulobacter mirabilis]ATQ43694.1 GNAT family N-acetyltransferase [Caulobacter mirabilis]